MTLEEFNEFCDEILDEYHVELPITLNQVDKYLTSTLLDLVKSLKEFSNSEKSISDIGKIHRVCREMFKCHLNKYIDTVAGGLLSKIWKVIFEFNCIEVPSVYAVLKPNNTIYSMSNPMLLNDENDSKKSSFNSILSALDMFESYILVKYVDMGGDVIIGKERND